MLSNIANTLIYCFSLTICISGNTNSLKYSYMLEDTAFRNVHPSVTSSVMFRGNTMTLFQCALLCESGTGCISLFYNNGTKKCELYGSDMRELLQSASVSSDGSRYFLSAEIKRSNHLNNSLAESSTSTASETTTTTHSETTTSAHAETPSPIPSTTTTSTISETTTTETPCPPPGVTGVDDCKLQGHSRVGPYCYRRILSEVTYETALSRCEELNGTVLVIDSDVEMACFKTFATSPNVYYNIGLERDGDKWKSGSETVTYLPWAPNNPYEGHNCVVTTNYKYLSWLCTRRNYVICEFAQYYSI